MSIIRTYSGQDIDLRNLDVEKVKLVDIAHSLSMQCRFSGHTRHFYSVAQHSVLVSYLVSPECALQGILHDAAEAYIGDITSPVKSMLIGIKEIEHDLLVSIGMKFGVDLVNQHPEVKHADLVALATEKRDLMPADKGMRWSMLDDIEPHIHRITHWPQECAKELFINRFLVLTGEA